MLQDRGHRVALVTPPSVERLGRGAVRDPCDAGGGGRRRNRQIRNSDVIRLDAPAGRLEVMVADDVWSRRPHAEADLSASHVGVGRELFGVFRGAVGSADEGAAIFRAA